MSAAKSDRADAIALLFEDKPYSFAELARLVQSSAPSPSVITAKDPLATALHLYACLETHQPLCILPASARREELAQATERMRGIDRDIALVLFTSGSQGQPKGVMLSRSALVASAEASARRHTWQDQERWLCCLPLHHIGGLSVLLRCLIDRQTAVLLDGFEVETVARALHQGAITRVSMVPTMLWRLLEAGHRAPPGLRLVLIGGAALDPQLMERALAAGYPVVHSYGLTETASQIVVMGRALDGVQLRVRRGRLEVRGPMLMRDYLPPHSDAAIGADGWLQTQDRARLHADGRVSILGRSDSVIISGGENIDLQKVEAGVQRCSGVKLCVALGLPHPEWGQELVALVLGAPGLDGARLRAEVDARLEGHLRPKRLLLVEEIPLLDNGKVDRQNARAIAESQHTEHPE